MSDQASIETAKELLSGLGCADIQALSLRALRQWHQEATDAEFSMHGSLGRYLVPILATRKNMTANAQTANEPFLSEQAQPWMNDVVEFSWSLVRAGMAIPLYSPSCPYPTRFRLTTAGARFLESTEDHPLWPDFLTRLHSRCPGLPSEVFEHLADARACLDVALGRPCVVLLGLGYEVAIDHVVDELVTQATLNPKGRKAKAWEKIELVRKALPQLISNPDVRRMTGHAWDFADQLRERRNHGAHSLAVYDFTDLAEVHELFLSAGRHLPALWATGSRQAVAT